MVLSVEGVYRDGKVELSEQPKEIQNETKVLVTFMNQGEVDLSSVGIDQEQAKDLRARLSTFEEEWERPEMDVYDRYEESKSKLQQG